MDTVRTFLACRLKVDAPLVTMRCTLACLGRLIPPLKSGSEIRGQVPGVRAQSSRAPGSRASGQGPRDQGLGARGQISSSSRSTCQCPRSNASLAFGIAYGCGSFQSPPLEPHFLTYSLATMPLSSRNERITLVIFFVEFSRLFHIGMSPGTFSNPPLKLRRILSPNTLQFAFDIKQPQPHPMFPSVGGQLIL